MTRELVLGAVVVLAAGSAAPGRSAGQAPPSASALQIEKIGRNLYALSGGGGNTAVFVTANGVVLVDTKLPGWGRPILEKVREITDKPVTTIINTHSHFDHVSGNVEFAPDVEIVAHVNAAALMRDMRQPSGVLTPQPNVFTAGNGAGLPTRTFTDQLTLGRGNDRIDLYYFGRAHTRGDAFVVFPALRAMHAGDAFPNKAIPIVDANNGGSGVEYADTIAKAGALRNIDTVITGHNPTTLTLADLKMYADFNHEFIAAVRAAKQAGQTIDDVAKTWKMPARFLAAGYVQPPQGGSGQGTERLRLNIELLWNELK